jgi:hypothetical protein
LNTNDRLPPRAPPARCQPLGHGARPVTTPRMPALAEHDLFEQAAVADLDHPDHLAIYVPLDLVGAVRQDQVVGRRRSHSIGLFRQIAQVEGLLGLTLRPISSFLREPDRAASKTFDRGTSIRSPTLKPWPACAPWCSAYAILHDDRGGSFLTSRPGFIFGER